MTDTAIEWTDKTWNPVTGCTKVSPGCANCYAEGVAERFWGKQYPDGVLSEDCSIKRRAREFTDVMTHAERLDQPLRWKKPARIFVNSMSDLFHEDVPAEFILRVFDVMERARWHTFQVLTKRASRMVEVLGGSSGAGLSATPLRNVWLGVSVENQHFADERIPLLLQTPAAVRFISAEPLLSTIDLEKTFWNHVPEEIVMRFSKPFDSKTVKLNPLFGLDWVIVGGESGPHARRMDIRWARSIVAQCQAAGVPVFVKQLGAHALTGYYDEEARRVVERTGRDWPDPLASDWNMRDGQPLTNARVELPLRNGKGGDPVEWPEDLRVRDFPEAK